MRTLKMCEINLLKVAELETITGIRSNRNQPLPIQKRTLVQIGIANKTITEGRVLCPVLKEYVTTITL